MADFEPWTDYVTARMLRDADARAEHESARADAAWDDKVKRFNGDFRNPPKMALSDKVGWALFPVLLIVAGVWLYATWQLGNG